MLQASQTSLAGARHIPKILGDILYLQILKFYSIEKFNYYMLHVAKSFELQNGRFMLYNMEIHVVTTVFEIFCGVIKLSTGPDNVS
jgi:hypothetical protein